MVVRRMKRFSKLIALFMAVLLVFLMAGCAESSDARDDTERLNTILNQLAEDAGEDGLGASMAVKYAAKFIAWGKSSALSGEDTARIVVDWLKERSPEMQQSVKKWVSEVASAGEEILERETENAKEAIQDGSWKEKVQTILDAVLESGGID